MAILALVATTTLTGCATKIPQPEVSPTASNQEVGGLLSGGWVSDETWLKNTEKMLPSIVKIETAGCGYTGSGTGFVVGNYIVTARHVVIDAEKITYKDKDGQVHKVEKWYYSKEDDIGLIEILDSQTSVGLTFSPGDGISGDLVATGGYPLGGPQISKRGRLVGKVKEYSLKNSSASFVWETTAQALPGDSGGPLLDTSGLVLGVVFAINNLNNYSLVVPVSRVKAAISQISTLSSKLACNWND